VNQKVVHLSKDNQNAILLQEEGKL